MRTPLDAKTIVSRLSGLDGWTGDTSSITRTAKLPSFRAVLNVVAEVGDIAEEMDHHPDIDIRWRTLTFTCSTHSAGGVTELDLRLAALINEKLVAANT